MEHFSQNDDQALWLSQEPCFRRIWIHPQKRTRKLRSYVKKIKAKCCVKVCMESLAILHNWMWLALTFNGKEDAISDLPVSELLDIVYVNQPFNWCCWTGQTPFKKMNSITEWITFLGAPTHIFFIDSVYPHHH